MVGFYIPFMFEGFLIACFLFILISYSVGYSESRNDNIKDRIASGDRVEFPRRRIITFLVYSCMLIILFDIYYIANIIAFILAFAFAHLLFWKFYYKEKNRLVIDNSGIINSTGFISGSRILWEDIAKIEFEIVGGNNRIINIVPCDPNRYWSRALMIQIDSEDLLKLLQERLERHKARARE